MPGTSLESFGGSTVQSIRRMNMNQQILLAGVFLAVVGAIVFISRLGGSTSMSILYSGLEPETAAGVVDELESRNIPYELSDSGRVVWVPRQQVASIRLDMSALGLPDSNDGWSILDDQGITSSEFDQRVGYQRAMEGELASTIAVIDGVVGANVHLVIPEQDLFVGDEIQASASVLLQTAGGAAISPTQVQAIVNLVASSVEGLTADQVTVTDDAGRMLAGGDADGLASMESDNQIRMRESFESDIERQLQELLVPVVGPGRAVVNVTADLDFDMVVRTEETYTESTNTNGETLPLSETTRVEEYGDGGTVEAGVVEIEDEILDGPVDEGSGGSSYRLDERDVVYALDSVITSTETAPGAIRSLSVAVVIDEATVPAERIAEIETLVTAAVGADAARGDVVAVNLLPFEVSVEEQEAAASEAAAAMTSSGSLLGMIRTAGAIIIGLVVLIMGLLMLRRASRRQVIDSLDLDEFPVAALESGVTPDGRVLERTEDDLLELVANQPDDIAAVLRQWLSEPEGVR
jgi:flagellar M-ring protein FliF